MSDTLSALDVTPLELDQRNEGALMCIGAVMVFDPLPGGGCPTVDDVCAGLAPRLAALPFSDDEQFELSAHVRHVALAAPGADEDLCEWAAEFCSQRLDRTRPPWEVALVEGLEHGRWAVAHKTHHCLLHEVSSVDVAHVLLDREPTPGDHALLDREPAPGDHALLDPEPAPGAPEPPPAPRPARGSRSPVADTSSALVRSRALAELVVRDEVIGAPRTSLNVPIGSTRRFAAVRAPLSELKAVSRELGGSVNDVILAACTSGLRRLLLERCEQPPVRGLRAIVPMNLRQASEPLALANGTRPLFMQLPVAEPMADARHREIVGSTARLQSDAAVGATSMIDLAALAPPVLHALNARTPHATRLFNIAITNVPGPQTPLFAFGARLREVLPLVPLAADHAVAIAVFSYDGQVTFGVLADFEATPDIAELAYGIELGIEELLALTTS